MLKLRSDGDNDIIAVKPEAFNVKNFRNNKLILEKCIRSNYNSILL